MSHDSNEPLQRTPLFDAHVKAGGKMVPFGGWEMPLHYGSQIEEHHITRKACGLFDVSHMGEVVITGPDALALVQLIVTNDMSKLNVGDEMYTVMCRANGGIVDDLIVARMSDTEYFIVVNASTYPKDVAFMREVAAQHPNLQAMIDPCAESWAMIAIQGPEWKTVASKVFEPGEWSSLAPFHARSLAYERSTAIISITGYTGEPGCEVLVPADKGEHLWDALIAAGGKPCGLAARDTLRLEKGYCLSGQDFTEENNPLEAGLAWVVKLSKSDFSGKAAIEQVKRDGVKKKLVGLLPEGRRFARHGNAVLADGKVIGEITSGGFSPSLNRPIAMAYVATAHAELGSEVEVDLGNTKIKAKVVKPPFYPEKS